MSIDIQGISLIGGSFNAAQADIPHL